MEASKIKIEKGIPVPQSRHTGLTSTMRKMKIGDSIVVPKGARQSANNAASNAKIKICTKTISSTELRVWRIE